jgi:SAM-dependent methyltransferase
MPEAPQKLFLHVGCGPALKENTTKEFSQNNWRELRFDIDPSVSPDYIGTMTDMSAVADDSFDAIYSSHNIEHLYPHEVTIALMEFRRVLKEDGFVVITCPDIQEVAKLVAEDKLLEPAYASPAGPISPLDILYGFRPAIARGNIYMAHRCGFTEKVLRGTLSSCGFKSVATMRRPAAYDLWAVACVETVAEQNLKDLARSHFP